MTLHILSQQNTVLNKFIAEIRDKRIQRDSMRFRRNMERIGEITAYEISKAFSYKPCVVETPLGEATVEMIDEQIVVATILRAGLPYHQGFLNYFDDAQNAFVSAYRKSTKDGKFTVKVEYISCGSLEGKTLLLVDPMLATGSSLVLTYNALCEKGGTPAHTHVAAVVASEQGLDYAMKNMPRQTTTIWTAVVDEELTSRSRHRRCGRSGLRRKNIVFRFYAAISAHPLRVTIGAYFGTAHPSRAARCPKPPCLKSKNRSK